MEPAWSLHGTRMEKKHAAFRPTSLNQENETESVIIQHLLELLMIQSDKLAYLTDLSGSRGLTSGETALSDHSEEHKVF